MLDVHHRVPVWAALLPAFYAAPHRRDDAATLFDAAVRSLGFDRGPQLPLQPSRMIGAAIVLAEEWGMTDLAEGLWAACDASLEPTWDRARGEFTWGLGLGEPYPRGQFNAFLAAGEAAGPGAWTRLSAAPLERCPQIVGVDVAEMVLSRAEWVDGNLRLGLAPTVDDPARSCRFRLVGAEPRNWDVHGLDGVRLDLTTSGLDISVPMVTADVELIRGSY